MTTALRLGCDVGGTFTDFVLLDIENGRYSVHKRLTTPQDPAEAIAAGFEALGGGAAVEYVIHGTTLVINALLERKGALTGVLATRGFADVIELRREVRYDIYDIQATYPAPLVPRPLRREVTERVLPDGTVLTPLDEDEVAEELDALVEAGVRSVAVAFLHAYANPAHEQAVAAIARQRHPGLAVSLSSEVLREIREYERTSTTVVNAYVQPLMAPYIDGLEQRLHASGLTGQVLLMLSGGGVTAPDTARRFPVRLIESGPVGGALAAAHLGRIAGYDDLIIFDMGGTTAKTTLMQKGQLPITTDYEVDRVHRLKRGSGTAVGVPTVDLIEIGSGGGSIARLNALGLIQVGPDSAGAEPGPACYGRGGQEPTVTDADLVLGYIDPDSFLGGRMPLDRAAAISAIERGVAKPLSLTTLEAAWGIHEVVNANMAASVRMYIAERGGDLSRTGLIAFGGAGPVHADGVARKLGVKRLLIPREAGVFSALGFLVAPVSYEVSRSFVADLGTLDAATFESLASELAEEARAVVAAAQPGAQVVFTRHADCCYAGQGATVRVEAADAASLPQRFSERYAELFGYAYDDLAVQLVTLRVTATASGRVPNLRLGFQGSAPELKGVRPAYAASARKLIEHQVYAMGKLPDGTQLEGPLIIEDDSSTLIVGPGAVLRVDGGGFLEVTL